MQLFKKIMATKKSLTSPVTGTVQQNWATMPTAKRLFYKQIEKNAGPGKTEIARLEITNQKD